MRWLKKALPKTAEAMREEEEKRTAKAVESARRKADGDEVMNFMCRHAVGDKVTRPPNCRQYSFVLNGWCVVKVVIFYIAEAKREERFYEGEVVSVKSPARDSWDGSGCCRTTSLSGSQVDIQRCVHSTVCLPDCLLVCSCITCTSCVMRAS